ncbi:IS30 family transposase [Streptobacillus canis]|uniref:IS30 family transposase n=1 Tax=Streptobacillus canis TaxID=2678686 RepID=UPI0012E2AA69|nr:IS30 family transposase [Streptobacillus canis]
MKQNLKYEDRIRLELYIREGKTITEIAKILDVSYHTIMREIRNRRILKFNDKSIGNHIEDVEFHICDLLKKQPIVCNKCPRYQSNTCSYDYVIYDPKIAQESYDRNKRTSKGSKQEKLLPTIQKGLKKGQPITHILSYLEMEYEEKISKKTIYNWIDKGIIKYNKKKIKKMKEENKKESYQLISRKELLSGKEYKDFLKYVEENKNCTICELDLVHGSNVNQVKGYLMTLFIANKQPQSIVKIFDWLEKRIGHRNFRRLFGLLLTDQGSEFLKFDAICKSVYDSYTSRCKIFYCDPKSPNQKPHVENIHTLLRRFIPKSRDIDNYTQDDINYIISNMNSLYKSKYKNKSPIKMFLEIYQKLILEKLNIEEIKYDEIVISSYNPKTK